MNVWDQVSCSGGLIFFVFYWIGWFYNSRSTKKIPVWIFGLLAIVLGIWGLVGVLASLFPSYF